MTLLSGPEIEGLKSLKPRRAVSSPTARISRRPREILPLFGWSGMFQFSPSIPWPPSPTFGRRGSHGGVLFVDWRVADDGDRTIVSGAGEEQHDGWTVDQGWMCQAPTNLFGLERHSTPFD